MMTNVLGARRRRVGAVVAAAGVLGAVVMVAAPAGAGTTLAAAAAERGRYFGTAVQAAKLTDAAYVGILDREFGMVTPENELKWDATEPARGTFNFTPADRVVNHARAAGQRVRGYGLVGPDAARLSWLANITSATELAAVLRDHVTGLVAHYRGNVYAWDVVSEAFADTGGGLRPSVWTKLGNGTGWIEDAFRAARAADPDARLCYNDYRIESLAYDKTQAVLAMVADFRARGVPIDCVGLQSHFGASAPLPADYRETIERFVALGVDVEITQLDFEGSGATQAAAYDTAVRACLAVARCAGITVWGVRDSDSWRSGSTPLLFDAAGAPKAAYTAVLNALNDTGGATTAAPTSARPTTAGPSTTAPPTTAPPTTVPPSPTCQATMSVSSWGGGFAASVRVTAGPVAVNRWVVTVVLPPGATITSVWGARPTGRTGTVRFADAGYNGRVPAGGSVSFGFVGTGRTTGATVLACAAG
ncbi:endo-1,4-beta-xylanase [Luedemannella flava]